MPFSPEPCHFLRGRREIRFQVNPLETWRGAEVWTKSRELLSLVPVGTLKRAPCPCDVTPDRNGIFARCPFFSTLKFNQVTGSDYGRTISLDPLMAIPSTQGTWRNISQLNNHVCYSCGVARANQYQIK